MSKNCAKFFDTHTTSKTYFYQIRNYSDPSRSFHKPLRDQNEIEPFPDPVPIEQDGVLHYTKGFDPKQQYLPPILVNVERHWNGV